jgi:hypothetical protein
MALCTGRDSFRERHADPAADFVGQLGRPQHAVGVAQPPELLGIAEIARRDVVEAVAFLDGVFL